MPDSRRSSSSSVNVWSELIARHAEVVDNALLHKGQQDGVLDFLGAANLNNCLERRGWRAAAKAVRNIVVTSQGPGKEITCAN